MRPIFAALAALALLTTAPALCDEQTELLMEALGNQDAAVRAKAASALEARGMDALPDLTQALWGRSYLAHQQAKGIILRFAAAAGAPGGGDRRRELALALLKQAQPRETLNVAARRETVSLLSLVAGPECADVLGYMARDEAIRDMALYALVRIKGPQARKAVASSLASAAPELKVAIAGALAERGEAESAAALRPLVKFPDAAVRAAAIRALGNLPSPESADTLLRASREGTPADREAAVDALGALADTLRRHGNTAASADVYRRSRPLATTPGAKAAWLSGYSRAVGSKALPDLTQAVLSADATVRETAATLLAGLPGPSVTPALVRALDKPAAPSRASIARALAGRDDPASTAALLKVASDASAGVRAQAVRALINRRSVSSDRLLPLLHALLAKSSDPEERQAALTGISRIASPSSVGVLDTYLARVPDDQGAYLALGAIADARLAAGDTKTGIELYTRISDDASDTGLLRKAAAKLAKAGVRGVGAKRGCVGRWWVLGPIPGREQWVAADAFDIRAADPATPVVVDGKSYQWKQVTTDDPQGYLDLGAAVGQADNSCAYALALLDLPQTGAARMAVGSDDDVFVWLNGRPVHQFVGSRGWMPDQDLFDVDMRGGKNRLLVKVLNGGAGWGVSVRLLDSAGKPVRTE